MSRSIMLAVGAFIVLGSCIAFAQSPQPAPPPNLSEPPAMTPQEQQRAARRAERKPKRDACRAEAIRQGLPRGEPRRAAIRNCMSQ